MKYSVHFPAASTCKLSKLFKSGLYKMLKAVLPFVRSKGRGKKVTYCCLLRYNEISPLRKKINASEVKISTTSSASFGVH